MSKGKHWLNNWLRSWVVWSLYDGSGYAVKDWAEADISAIASIMTVQITAIMKALKSFILILNTLTCGLTAISW
ncbi:hypothetical protein [Escherichia coli]